MYLKKKTAIPLVFALIISTLVIGSYAYAHWEETLYLYGTVTTGIFDMEFTKCFTDDDNIGGHDPDYVVENWDDPTKPVIIEEPEGKDIGVAWCEYDAGTGIVTVYVENGYPGYAFELDVRVKNTGTIPWRMWFTQFKNKKWMDAGYVPLNVDGDGKIEIYIETDDSAIGDQTDPGEELDLSYSIYLTNWVLEGEHLSFEIKLHFLNWNEWFDPGINVGPYKLPWFVDPIIWPPPAP